MDSVLSKLSYGPSLEFVLITRFVCDPLLEFIPRPTRLQRASAVRNKIETLLSRIPALEALFATRPDDVAEQRRRSELIRCVVIPPLYSVLIPFQQVRGHRGTIEVFVRGPGAAATY